MIILRILAGLIASLFFIFGILIGVTLHNWKILFGMIIFTIPFFMYAVRGNNWNLWDGYPYIFKNVNKKNNDKDFYGSIDLSLIKKLFKKNSRRRGCSGPDGSR